MGLRQTLTQSHEALERAGVAHALIGGMGLAALGIHRATEDVDYLVHDDHKEKAQQALEGAGWKMVFQTEEVLHFEGKGRVDLLLARRPLSHEMLTGAGSDGKTGIPHVRPEGIIGLKIQAFVNDKKREFQDKADIQAIVTRFPDLDWDKVKIYADLFDQWGFLQSLRSGS